MSDESSERVQTLTSIRTLAKNTFWNLLGRFLPLLAALVSIPQILHGLGTERFGLLTLALTFVGYFGLLDFGLGNALTQAISERIGLGREGDAPTFIWTGLSILLPLSVLGVGISLALAPAIIHLLKVSAEFEREATHAFYLLTLSIPFVILSAAFWGVLAAYQRFDLGNRVSIPMGIATYVGPLLILPWSNSLIAVMAVLLLARITACIGFGVVCWRSVPAFSQRPRFDRNVAYRLMTFGGWMTLSGIMTPLLTSVDRFIVGGFVSIAAVAFYAAPYEVVVKLWVVPTAFMSVLGPAFAVQIASRSGAAHLLFQRALTYLFLVIFPITIVMTVFARDGLAVWLGPDFADRSMRVLQCLAAGMFFGCLAQLPMVLMSSLGRPDLMAKIRLLEVPVYVPVLSGAIAVFGIEGAAAAWAIRMIVESLVSFLLAGRFMPEIGTVVRRALLATPVLLIMFALGSVIVGLALKFAYAGLVLALLAALAWRLLGAGERQFMLTHLRHFGVSLGLRG